MENEKEKVITEIKSEICKCRYTFSQTCDGKDMQRMTGKV